MKAIAHHDSGADCALCNFKLQGAHPYMRTWFIGKKAKYQNLHVSWAWRDQLEQDKAVKEGKSKLQFPDSPHNYTLDGKPCSLALDLFQIDEDGVARFSTKFYALLADEIEADREPIIWGAVYKSLGDFDHFQLDPKKVPQ